MTAPAAFDLFSDDDSVLAVLLDPDHRVIQRSPGWSRFEPSAADANDLAALLREEDALAARDALGRLAADSVVLFDARPRGATTSDWVRFRASLDASGRTRVFGVPIGDLKKVPRSATPQESVPGARTMSREDEGRLRLFARLLDSTPFMIWALDRDGIVTMSDGAGLSVIGSQPGGWIGRNALDDWKGTAGHEPMLRAMAGEEFRGTVSLPGPLHFESWYLPLRTPSGELDGMIGVAVDVTRERVIEAELREKLATIEAQRERIELFGRVLDHAPLIVSTIDRKGTFTLSEGKGLEPVGLRPGEAVGLDAFETFKGTPMEQALHAAFAGESRTFQYEASPGLLFDNWCLPLTHTKNGEVVGALTLSIDSSDRLRVERELRDKLALIERQGETIRALTTPILKVWDEVLCLPLIGTLDSRRTADVMEAMLNAIMEDEARFAIVDLTGVDVVDTRTAEHLIRLFKAAKLLGATGILCGIQPAVAQTVVALGTELQDVMTARTLAEALKGCIGRGQVASST